MKKGLFIFRRDYRIVDNSALIKLSQICDTIYPIFIFTPEQVGRNLYKSDRSVQFMIESLKELNQITGNHLSTFYGTNIKVLEDLFSQNKIDIVAFNCDYTPYSIQRDISIIKLCEKHNIQITFEHDYNLNHPDQILNSSHETYQKFTPYYESALKHGVASVKKQSSFTFSNSISSQKQFNITLDEAMMRFTTYDPEVELKGGRTRAIAQLKVAKKQQHDYSNTHNTLSFKTSQLSAYIKFGCISIREVYFVMKHNTSFVRQLYWRDFYSNILYSFPHVLGKSLKPKYDAIRWSQNKKFLDAWKKGETGFPIVDAGMRQLNQTGYMHNRARLIVASFLVKTLLQDWREGERYFASRLIDYDVASNNGNWQWIMGGGADSQPYFRIFNPWLQSIEHDKEAIYIKTWVKELMNIPVKDIHRWYETGKKYSDIHYALPIVDFSSQKDKILALYHSHVN